MILGNVTWRSKSPSWMRDFSTCCEPFTPEYFSIFGTATADNNAGDKNVENTDGIPARSPTFTGVKVD
jgi:hypothetical protein